MASASPPRRDVEENALEEARARELGRIFEMRRTFQDFPRTFYMQSIFVITPYVLHHPTAETTESRQSGAKGLIERIILAKSFTDAACITFEGIDFFLIYFLTTQAYGSNFLPKRASEMSTVPVEFLYTHEPQAARKAAFRSLAHAAALAAVGSCPRSGNEVASPIVLLQHAMKVMVDMVKPMEPLEVHWEDVEGLEQQLLGTALVSMYGGAFLELMRMQFQQAMMPVVEA